MPKKNKTIKYLSVAMINGFDNIERKLGKMETKEELRGFKNDVITVIDGLENNVNDFQAERALDQTAHDRMAKYVQSA